jgi:hypothetical protein
MIPDESDHVSSDLSLADRWHRTVWNLQIGSENMNTQLTLSFPLVGERCHRKCACKAHCGAGVSKLFSRAAESQKPTPERPPSARSPPQAAACDTHKYLSTRLLEFRAEIGAW